MLAWRCGVEEHGVDFVEGCEVISWDIQAHWLGEWKDRAAPISKAFSVLFPFLIVGLLNATAVQGSGAAQWIQLPCPAAAAALAGKGKGLIS